MARTPAFSFSPGRRLMFSIIVVPLMLGLLEGVARLVETALQPNDLTARISPGWQAKFFGAIFDWNEPDPDLLWRFKPNLNSALIKTNACGLIADDIEPHKPSGTVRVMVLGDSSPAGLGLRTRTETFAEILRRRLSVFCGDLLRCEMINASVPGYSSEQVRRFLEHFGWSYEPDLLIVYCGNNDASFSGPLSDRQLISGQSFGTVRRLLAKSAFYRLLRSLLKSGQTSHRTNDMEPLTARVSPRRYRENLQAIVDQARDRRVPVVVLKPPVPLLWPAGLQFNIFRKLTAEDGGLLLPDRMIAILGRQLEYCLDTTLIRYIYGDADPVTRAVLGSAFHDRLPPARAVSYWQERIRKQTIDPVSWNNLAVAWWRTSAYDSADSVFGFAAAAYESTLGPASCPADSAAEAPLLYNRGINALGRAGIDTISCIATDNPAYPWLDSALQLDYFSLRIKRCYVDQIDSVRGRDDLTVIDLSPLFGRNGGERRFVDHCHPDALGHRLIADTLLPRVWDLLRPAATRITAAPANVP